MLVGETSDDHVVNELAWLAIALEFRERADHVTRAAPAAAPIEPTPEAFQSLQEWAPFNSICAVHIIGCP